jgi:hypothetical protein
MTDHNCIVLATGFDIEAGTLSKALDGGIGSQMNKSCGNDIERIKMLCNVIVIKIIFGENDCLFARWSLQNMYLLDMTYDLRTWVKAY